MYFQVVVLYLMTVFMLKQFMNNREAFKLEGAIKVNWCSFQIKNRFLQSWNLIIATLSGICAAGMTAEFFTTLFGRGINGEAHSNSDAHFEYSISLLLYWHILPWIDGILPLVLSYYSTVRVHGYPVHREFSSTPLANFSATNFSDHIVDSP